MQIRPTLPGALAAAAVLAYAASSQAAVITVTSLAAFNAAIAGGSSGTDNFSDLTINTFFSGPVNRSAGLFGYRASTTTGDFFVAPTAGFVALSVEESSASIVLDNFSRTVFAVGGNFFNTNVLGEFTGGAINGPITVRINDFNGGAFSNTFTPTGITTYRGFLSDTRIRSVTVSNGSTVTGPWEAIDNLTLAVPEPSSVALTVLALGLAVGVSRRRPALA